MRLRSLYTSLPPAAQLLFVVLIATVCLFLTQIINLLVLTLLPGIQASELIHVGQLDINILKLLQIITSLGTFLIPAVIIANLSSQNQMGYLGLSQGGRSINYVWVFLLMLSAIPLINFMAEWNAGFELPDSMKGIEQWIIRMEEDAKSITERMLESHSILGLLLSILTLAIIPAISEEVLFRGVIQRLFFNWSKNIHIAVILAAVLFSAVHFQFFGFIPRLLLGIMFGYLYVWSGSLWVPIFAHFLNNTIASLAFYFYHTERIQNNPDTWGSDPGNYWLYLSILMLGLFLFLIYRKRERGLRS